ncbi:MAG TPA: hypothetical protein VGO47_02570 [Chlamydiales bacterium]|jgi:hypothetical protein|nr:hypothetical protein [Chlamydiales bacterium]
MAQAHREGMVHHQQRLQSKYFFPSFSNTSFQRQVDATPSERLAMQNIHDGLASVMDVDTGMWDVEHCEDWDWEGGDLNQAVDGTYSVDYHTKVAQETTGQVADVYYHFFVGGMFALFFYYPFAV